MQRIKFSHRYHKFPDDFKYDKHFIISVSVVDVKDLPSGFLPYDTAYWNKELMLTEYFPIDFKKGILIFIFSAGKKKVWTTLRRWTEDKEKHYRKLIGKQVEIVMESKNG